MATYARNNLFASPGGGRGLIHYTAASNKVLVLVPRIIMLSKSSTEFLERQRQRQEEYLVILKMDAGVTAHEQAWPLACG